MSPPVNTGSGRDLLRQSTPLRSLSVDQFARNVPPFAVKLWPVTGSRPAGRVAELQLAICDRAIRWCLSRARPAGSRLAAATAQRQRPRLFHLARPAPAIWGRRTLPGAAPANGRPRGRPVERRPLWCLPGYRTARCPAAHLALPPVGKAGCSNMGSPYCYPNLGALLLTLTFHFLGSLWLRCLRVTYCQRDLHLGG